MKNIKVNILTVKRASEVRTDLFNVIVKPLDSDETIETLLVTRRKDATSASEGMKEFFKKLVLASHAEGEDKIMKVTMETVLNDGGAPTTFIAAQSYEVQADELDAVVESL